MARVTVEDCLPNVDNRFQLVLVAAKRARQLSDGAEPCVDRASDKPTVVALREIAGGYVTKAILDEVTQVNLYEGDEAENEAGAPPEGAPLSEAPLDRTSF